jgi:hypothetical protein
MTGTASSQVAEIIHPVGSARPQIRPENFSERTSLVISLGPAFLMTPRYETPIMALFEDDIEIKPRPLGVPVTEPVIVLNPLLLPFSPLCQSKRQSRPL